MELVLKYDCLRYNDHMNKLYLFFAVTVGAWLVHVALVNTYMKAFENTHSLTFRLLYSLEISIVFGIAIAIYLLKVENHVELGVALTTVVLFLAFVDSLLLIFMSSVRQAFSLSHFGVAYASVAIVMTLLYRLIAK